MASSNSSSGLSEILASIVPEFTAMGEAFELLNPEVMLAATGLEEIGPALGKVAQQVGDVIGPTLEALAEEISNAMVPVVKAVSASLEALKPTFAALGVGLKAVAVAVGAVLNPLGAVSQAFSSAASAVGHAFASLGHAVASAATALGEATKKASEVLLSFAQSVASTTASLARGIAEAATGFVQLSLSMSAANQFLSAAARGLSFFTSSLTAGISALTNAVAPFVQAIAPGVAFGLNYALRSLAATIGTALVPVANALSSALHRISGILLPAMQAIAPALGSITQALMTFVEGTVRSFADTLNMLAPVFDMLANVSHMLVSAWDGLRAVMLAVIDTMSGWIKSFFGGTGDMKDVLASFRDGIHKVTEAVLKFTVMLSKTLGFSAFQANLVKNLNDLAGKRPGELKAGAAPAATDAAFRGFEDFAKTIAQSAFIAQGGGEVAADAKSEREWLADLAKSVSEIKSGGVVAAKMAEMQAFFYSTRAELLKVWLAVSDSIFETKWAVLGAKNWLEQTYADVKPRVSGWSKAISLELGKLSGFLKGILPF